MGGRERGGNTKALPQRGRAEKPRLSMVPGAKPSTTTSSFHGRDLFAPVAARLARGKLPPGLPRFSLPSRGTEWLKFVPGTRFLVQSGIVRQSCQIRHPLDEAHWPNLSFCR
jgi:S-adenosyl-l-methionine hydroxide adenosyltransferase